MSDSHESQLDKEIISQERDGGKEIDLAQLLVEHKIISSAQAQLAKADQEVSGMTFVDVLLARSWIEESTLYTLAPWLRKAGKSDILKLVKKPSKNYKENLQQYRQIMEQILGTPWD